ESQAARGGNAPNRARPKVTYRHEPEVSVRPDGDPSMTSVSRPNAQSRSGGDSKPGALAGWGDAPDLEVMRPFICWEPEVTVRSQRDATSQRERRRWCCNCKCILGEGATDHSGDVIRRWLRFWLWLGRALREEVKPKSSDQGEQQHRGQRADAHPHAHG